MLNQSQWNTGGEGDTDFFDYFIILWKRKWGMLTIFIIIIALAIVVNLLMTPTFESNALIKIGTYQNNSIETLADLNVILSSEPTLKKLNDDLELDLIDIQSIVRKFDVKQKKISNEKTGISNYFEIKGRSDSPEKAQAITDAVKDLILIRHTKLFKEAQEKFDMEVELINREQQATKTLIKQKEEELARLETDIKNFQTEIAKRADAQSEGQGRIVESYIKLLAEAKKQKEQTLVQLEGLKQKLTNFDVKFQEKEFEKKYQTKPTTVSAEPNLPQTKIAPERKKNVEIAAVLAIFLAILYAFVAEFINKNKSRFKNLEPKQKSNEPPVPPTIHY